MGFYMGNETQNLINLVTDAQNGVAGAFDKLYHESFMHAYCTASLLLKNEEDIEDALQNAYMYVARYIKDLKNPESFSSWLGVIVKHECQKFISKKKRISDIFIAVKKANETDLLENGIIPDDYIEKSETADTIRRIVDSLPEDKRACIVLFYYEQHSLAEISEILGVAEGTVMSRLFYARKKLEKEFKKLQKKDESLLGISVIPFIISLFAYQAKTVIVPSAAESAIIAAVSAESVVVTSATVGSSSAAISSGAAAASSSAGAGMVGGAVAAKITAVAVAATVAVGGGVATVNHIRKNSDLITTQADVAATVEDATAADVFEEATTVTSYEETTGSLRPTQPSTGVPSETTEKSTTNPVSTTVITTVKETTKPQTAETTKPKVAETTSRNETTTKYITTTVEQTTDSANVFSVFDGVLNEYTGSDSNISIPSKVGSSNVTAIGTGAFLGNTDVKSVSFPSTVTRIGMEAFSDCTNLRSISLPSSLESIGIGAFYGCSSLTRVEIPSRVTSIGDDAFSDCTNLSDITIPSSVISIGDNAFGGCDNLTIRCYKDSAAYNYAADNSIEYILL